MLKTCFFGTSDRSTPILNTLKEHSELLLCVTKSDTKTGRHQEPKESGVKKWCKSNGVEFVEIEKFKESESEKLIEQLISSNLDYILVADFSFIIPSDFIDRFRNKIINIHFSLLPLYRGASPVQFALLNGDDITGVSFLYLTDGIDKGNILKQYEYNIPTKVTSGELLDELFDFTSIKMVDFLDDLKNDRLSPTPQDDSKASFTSSKTKPKSTMIYKDDALIDWDEPVDKIERQVRAYSPWPISWTYLKWLNNNKRVLYFNNKFKVKDSKKEGLKVKIFETEIVEGKLKINKIQIEGKKVMNWNEFENGFLTQ